MGNEVSLINEGDGKKYVTKNKKNNPDIILYDSNDVNNKQPSFSDSETWEDKVRKRTSLRTSEESKETLIVPQDENEEKTEVYTQDPKLLSLLFGPTDETQKEEEVEGEITPFTIDGKPVILHKVLPTDTLQKIAIKYNVTTAEIKKANKLWTNDHVFTRKELVIPISHEQFLLQQQKKTQTNIVNATGDKRSLVHRFVEITQCDEKFAYQFLLDHKWNFVQALSVYYPQNDGSMDNHRHKSFDEEKNSKEEIEETWEEEKDNKTESKTSNGKGIASYVRSGKKSGVGIVGKNTQKKFLEQDAEIFEI